MLKIHSRVTLPGYRTREAGTVQSMKGTAVAIVWDGMNTEFTYEERIVRPHWLQMGDVLAVPTDQLGGTRGFFVDKFEYSSAGQRVHARNGWGRGEHKPTEELEGYPFPRETILRGRTH